MFKKDHLKKVLIIILISIILYFIFKRNNIETFQNINCDNNENILSKVKYYFKNNLLLLRTNDGQTIFNSDELANTISSNSNLKTLGSDVNNYMSNLGPGFSATFIGKTMTPVAWYVPAYAIPPAKTTPPKEQRATLAFILNTENLRIHSGTIFDGNTNARITYAGGPSSAIRGQNSSNFFSQHPIKFDGEDVNTEEQDDSTPPKEFWGENLNQNVGNLVNMYNPLIMAGNDEDIVGDDKISEFLSQINTIKNEYETRFEKHPNKAKKYINKNLKSGVESEIIVSSVNSKTGKLTFNDILCVVVITDSKNKKILQETYDKGIDNLIKNSSSWLEVDSDDDLQTLPRIGIMGVALPVVPFAGGGTGVGPADEWINYYDEQTVFAPRLNSDSFISLE